MNRNDRSRFRTARTRADLRRGRTDWFQIGARAPERVTGADVARVDIIGEIGYFGVTAEDFTAELRGITAATIEMHVHSPGGDAFDGVTIYNQLVDHPAAVTTIVDGLAVSAASIIAMAGDTRIMNPGSEMMIHNGSTFCIGDAADMRSTADRLELANRSMAAIYTERAGGTVEHWLEAMAATSWYSADEAVTAGLATELGRQADREPVDLAASWDLSIFAYSSRSTAPAPPATPDTPPNVVDAAAAVLGANGSDPDAERRPPTHEFSSLFPTRKG